MNNNMNRDKITIKKSQIWISLIVIVAIILLVLIYMNWDELKPDVKKVGVNGHIIYGEEVERVKQAFKQQTGTEINDSQALEQLIGRTLLIQEAQKRNIIISDSEVELLLTQQAGQYGLDLNSFKSQMKDSGVDYNELFEAYRDQIQMQELVTKIMEERNVSVSEVEIREFYDSNKEIFEEGGEEMSYENMKEQIELIIKQQKGSEVITDFIEELKIESEIVYY